MSNFSNSLKKLGDAVVDLAELEVITLTGTLGDTYGNIQPAVPAAGAQPAQPASFGGIKWAQLIGESLSNPKGEVKLAASTLIKIDGDTYNFISSDPAVTETTLAAHAAAVNAGKASREALCDFFKDVVGNLAKP